MLNQRPNSDADPVLPTIHTQRTYTHTIYATRTHHYTLNKCKKYVLIYLFNDITKN